MKHEIPLLHKPHIWDLILTLFIAAPLLLSKIAVDNLQAPWSWAIACVLVLCSACVAYGSFVESKMIVVNKKSIHVSGLPSVKIAIIADFHVGPYKGARYVKRIVKKANALHADIVLIPGDFLFDHLSKTQELDPLKDLRARLGVFAIMGNHDMGEHMHLNGAHFRLPDSSPALTAFLRERGIVVLRNQWQTMSINNTEIAIAGLDGQWHDQTNCDKHLKDIPANLPLILLAHNPDTVLDGGCMRANLIVSGHTHGGQVRFPPFGALYVPAKTGTKYAQGIFKITEKTTLAVTHGIGETLMRARFCCPPEILVLDINEKESEEADDSEESEESKV